MYNDRIEKKEKKKRRKENFIHPSVLCAFRCMASCVLYRPFAMIFCGAANYNKTYFVVNLLYPPGGGFVLSSVPNMPIDIVHTLLGRLPPLISDPSFVSSRRCGRCCGSSNLSAGICRRVLVLFSFALLFCFLLPFFFQYLLLAFWVFASLLASILPRRSSSCT